MKTSDSSHEVAGGERAELPDAARSCAAVSSFEIREADVQLPQQQGGACRCAAATDPRGFHERDTYAGARELRRDRAACDAAADNRDVSVLVSAQRFVGCGSAAAVSAQP